MTVVVRCLLPEPGSLASGAGFCMTDASPFSDSKDFSDGYSKTDSRCDWSKLTCTPWIKEWGESLFSSRRKTRLFFFSGKQLKATAEPKSYFQIVYRIIKNSATGKVPSDCGFTVIVISYEPKMGCSHKISIVLFFSFSFSTTLLQLFPPKPKSFSFALWACCSHKYQQKQVSLKVYFLWVHMVLQFNFSCT